MSSSSSDSPDLASAKQKIAQVIEYDSLPAAVVDPLWDKIEKKAGLSLGQLGALKNARCNPSSGKYCPVRIFHIIIWSAEFSPPL